MRLDEFLVQQGHFPSRARARDAILRGRVTVDGRAAAKPGLAVGLSAEVHTDDPARTYVSRAALKLLHALDVFGFDPSGCHALDIGASTGGFTQVLLERAASRVTAVDVGHRQMHPDLAADPRVTNLEGVNARSLTVSDVQGAPGFLVCDVSFISLKLALPPSLALAAQGAKGIFLVKPQFEAGRAAIGKGGLLRDRRQGHDIAEGMQDWLATNTGWRACGLIGSPIRGSDGNQEFLLAGVRDA